MTKQRLDVAIVERGLASSRERARAAIIAGLVRVGEQVVTKAGAPVATDASITVAAGSPYVSRGGAKLEGALRAFGLDVTGARAVDIGASTGGFTDCLLQHGAIAVAAIDVGYGQLAWSLRTDERVSVFERTNIRDVDPTLVGAPFELCVIDVSFIGLAKVLPAAGTLVGPEGTVLALVKPQFEAGKGRVGKKGVVRDRAVHEDVLHGVVAAAAELGWVTRGLAWSPVKGPEGNIEFWMWLARTGSATFATPESIVEGAYEALGDARASSHRPEHE